MAGDACSFKKPAAIYKGKCTGHGIGAAGAPLAQHPTVSSQCLAAACTDVAIRLPLVQKNAQCYWPPEDLVPMPPALLATTATKGAVLINKIAPILDQDLLTYHKSHTMNTVITTCPGNPPTNPPTTCNCTTSLVTEDKGGIGHERKAVSTGKSVFVNKKRLCRVGDPLNGMHVGCLSMIAGGAEDVLVGD